ncbi:MAG: DUF285 domain-containing protein, partial [Proteobacteria bacterium]|nr:DUF285 domain-containing protein [Pseudomonadota bacterium]
TCTNGCVGGGCITSSPETDDNHNHMNDAYETATNQGKACRKYADCDTAPGKGDGFCDSFIGYKCSTKCTSDDQCVDDDEFHYICRPDGRCAPDTFTFVINIKKNDDNDYRFSLDTDYISDCNFTIDWGDGSRIKKYESKNALPLDDMGNFSHNYLVPGIYTVKIKGKYDGFKIANDGFFLVVSEDGDASYYMSYYIVEIKSFGPVGLGRWGEFALEDYRNLNKLSQVDIPDASKLTSLHRAFSPNYDNSSSQDIEPLFNAPLNNWDISNVTDLSDAFYNARFYNQPLNDWDTSHVTDMRYMFARARRFNQPLNDWDTSNVTDMIGIFAGATSFNQPINDWDTSHITKMINIFGDPWDEGASAFNQPLNHWDTSNVTDMTNMFYGANAFNQPINHWDTSNVTNMNSMFYGANAFNQPINHWDTSNVTNMRRMFLGANAFNQPLDNWNTSNVTDMGYMFYNATAFNQPLDNWNTSNVKDMSYMFYNATAFNSSINNWDILHVTNMNSMFYNATAFNQPMNWNATYVKDMRSMFNGATSFNQDISGWRKNYYASLRVHTDSMFKNSAMSQENYCKIANSWNYNGDLGMNYTCH